MKIKKLYSELFLLIILLIITIIGYSSFNNREVLKNEHKVKSVDSNMISLMIESDKDGEYIPSESNEWPGKWYSFNQKLSKCENGGTLIFNEEKNKIIMKTIKSDKCYAYFDKSADFILYTHYNNSLKIPDTYGPLALLNCDNSSVSYNEKYNRIEMNGINNKNTRCELSFNDVTNKIYLNNYVIGLENSTQGNGKLIHEIAGIADYSNVTTLSKEDYGSPTAYYSTYISNSSGTNATSIFSYSGDEWSGNSSSMISGKYYHLKLNVPEDGYYQLCYSMTSGYSANTLYIFNGNAQIPTSVSASESQSKSGCIAIGKAYSESIVKIVQRAYIYGSYGIPTIKFKLQKSNDVKTYETGYRYEGKNPNNYIWFNNELWRIIGVFDENTHGQSGQQLVKIVRDEYIGYLAWDKMGTKNWKLSSLNKLLNPIEGEPKSGSYYNKEDGTSSGYCYGSSGVIANCNYTLIGIDKNYREMIKKVNWKFNQLTTSAYITMNVNEWYLNERGIDITDNNVSNSTGHIGLLYPSDYGYASLSNECSRLSSISNNYRDFGCAGKNWLYGSNDKLTMLLSSGNNLFEISSNGNINVYGSNTTYGSGVNPAIYLNEKVFIKSGTGNITDPYIIGI